MFTVVSPADAAATECTRVDVREYPEFAAGAIPGARLAPLGILADTARDWPAEARYLLVCRSGKRARLGAEKLAALGFRHLAVLDGGMDAWRAAGLPVHTAARQPWSLERQVRMAAGMMILISVGLGIAVSPWFFAWTAFVGAGLALAAATDTCMMASLLSRLPWNRPRNGSDACASPTV